MVSELRSSICSSFTPLAGGKKAGFDVMETSIEKKRLKTGIQVSIRLLCPRQTNKSERGLRQLPVKLH